MVDLHAPAPRLGGHDVTQISGVSNTITPLWSLVWEVCFSLLLPVYVAVAHRARPRIGFVVPLALVAVGAVSGNQVLIYLPMFAVGVSPAHGWNGLSVWAAGVNSSQWSSPIWLGAAAASVVLVTSHWLLMPISPVLAAYAAPLIVIGVSGLVLAAAFSPPARAVLSLRAVLWLGVIAFSLYLTNEPMLLAMAHIFPTSPKLAAAIGILVAIPRAFVFHRLVERPIHRLVQWSAGRRAVSEVQPAQPDRGVHASDVR